MGVWPAAGEAGATTRPLVTWLLAIAVVVLAVRLAYRRARRRPSLDKYAGMPPVGVIPNRPDRRGVEER